VGDDLPAHAALVLVELTVALVDVHLHGSLAVKRPHGVVEHLV
jgi:hypothetical protein